MKAKLLLHSCCAPCSSSVIERLSDQYEITVVYYNPNIEPEAEYLKRKKEQIRLLNLWHIPYLEFPYANQDFKEIVRGYEDAPENGPRCWLCYRLRLEKTAKLAQTNGFNIFTTTLTVSPQKKSVLINEIGLDLAEKYQVKYLTADFKKADGYLRSIQLAKEYDLYRQNYCGCLYNKSEKE